MFRIRLFCSESPDSKLLDKQYGSEASAESAAFFLLGTKTPFGIICATHVLGADGTLLNEFEF